MLFLQFPTDEPPKVNDHPKSLKDALLDEPVTFTIQATGTEPLNYHWEHKSRDGSQGWQSCDVESFPGANSSTLTIPSVQKSNEGNYRCTVSNLAGSENSECATLTLGELTACTLFASFSGPKRMHMHCVLHNMTLIDESSTLQVLSYVFTVGRPRIFNPKSHNV